MELKPKPILILSFAFLVVGCLGSLNEEIVVTPEYIINKNWDEQANAIQVQKMRLKKDSLLDVNRLSQSDVLSKLEEDSSFLYVANVTKIKEGSSKNSPVYFDKDNGFYWWSDKGESKKKTIGNLAKGNWYKFSNLVTYPYYVYVYVDSTNKVHRQDVNLANY